MSNMNLLEMAKGKGSMPFFSWFRERLGKGKLDPTRSIYQAGILFKTLGIHQRSYQSFELVEDFPVRRPIRAGESKTSPRLYTKANFVDIAYWYWLRKVAGDGQLAMVLTVRDVAKRLYLRSAVVLRMMRDGTMPGTGESVVREEFASWLHGKIGVSE